MSTQEQRRQWRELADAATPGNYFYRGQCIYSGMVLVCVIPARNNDTADAAFIAAARAAVPALLADVDALTQERDALAAELERVRGELATGKPQPTQRENDDAAARIKRIDELYKRYSLGGCFGVSEWPEYAQSEFERLDTAQREYEAKYC